jgi:hypothetical protein
MPFECGRNGHYGLAGSCTKMPEQIAPAIILIGNGVPDYVHYPAKEKFAAVFKVWVL